MPVPPPASRIAIRSISSEGVADLKREQEGQGQTPKPTTRSISSDGLAAMRRGANMTVTKQGEIQAKFSLVGWLVVNRILSAVHLMYVDEVVAAG